MLGVVAAVLAAVVYKRIQLKLPTMLGPELADFSRSSRGLVSDHLGNPKKSSRNSTVCRLREWALVSYHAREKQ